MAENYIISGIQQVGIGCTNVEATFKWCRQFFGADVPVFDEEAVAALMLPYTGGQPQARRAILALNMQGGGGFEIWQYTKRPSNPPAFKVELGDLGLYAVKIKCFDAQQTFDSFKAKGANILSQAVETSPAFDKYFWMADPQGNVFQVIEAKDWFQRQGKQTGGVYGVVIGVSNLTRSVALFKDVLGYDEVVYEKTVEVYGDLAALPGGQRACARAILRHSQPRKGAFSKLLGATEIELVQSYEYEPRKIFENRYWGELGFIHLCFDVNGMEALKKKCTEAGFPFTVDSANSFDMGEAAGRFAYIEDPDGALIEFVETHKVPILKKIGWYLNLSHRNPEKPLPNWMVKALGLNRVKD